MDADRDTVKAGAIVGVLLAGFFVVGFGASSVLASSTPTGQIVSDQDDTSNDIQQVTPDNISSRVEEFIYSSTAPPVRRVKVTSVTEDDTLTTGEFYRADISLYVEPNPLPGPIYSVPENSSYAWNNMTFYVTADGKYFFSDTPNPLEVPQGPPR